ncbi:MAG: pitrilysin family protein [Candidatus Eisenbacteria bacterium]
MKKHILFCCIALVVLAGPGDGAEPTIARLGNGLEVILIENHGSPMIAATMVVRAGADLETAASSGASHMMEHLLFNGTERRTQKELYDETDLYGIYNNATTRRFHTDYFVLVSKERIRQAMDIQADMLFHSVFPEEKFEKERGIVLEELGKDEQDPSTMADLLFRAVAFAGTPYARPILGTRPSIGEMSREDVMAYHGKTYVPNNMTLVVIGDFLAEPMLDLSREIYGKEPAARLPAFPAMSPPEIRSGERTRIFHGESEKGFLSMALGAPPGGGDGNPGFEAIVDFLAHRLSADLAEGEAPLLFSIGASYERRETWGRLIVSAAFDPEKNVDEMESRILESVRLLIAAGPGADEVERFRVSAKTGEIYLSEKPHMVGLMKAEAYGRGGYDAVRGYLEALDGLDPARIGAELGEAVDPERRVSVAYLPGEKDWEEEDIAVVVAGEAPVWESCGLEAPPEGGETVIVSRPAGAGAARSARADRVDTTFANGLRLAVISNDDSEVFAIHLLAKNRSWQEPAGEAGAADLLHRILLKGAGDLGGDAQRAALERIGAEVKVCDAGFIPYDDYYTVPSYSFVRFTTIEEHAGRGVDLFADMIRRPRFDGVEGVKQEMLMLAGGRASKPSDLSRALLGRALYGDHPLASDPEGTAGTIEALTKEDVELFHEMYFAPDNLILTVVTSRPPAEVVRMMGGLFADARRFTKRKPAPPLPSITTADTAVEETTGASQGYIRTGYVIEVPEEDRAALQVATAILSDEMAFDLRETRGLAYSIGAGVSFLGDRATVSASIGTSPENFDEALAGIRGHLDRSAARETLEPEELEKAVNGLLGRMNMRRLSRPNQAYRAGLAIFTGSGEGWVDELRGLTPEDVLAAGNKYLRSGPAATALVR